MKCSWKRRLLAGTMTAAVAAGSGIPVFASAAPDGKTSAADLATAIHADDAWKNWQNEWNNTVSKDWTQISLTPGSDATQLNFAWYSLKNAVGSDSSSEEQSIDAGDTQGAEQSVDAQDTEQSAAIAAQVAEIDPQAAEQSAPKLIIGRGRSMRDASVYVAEQEDATTDSKTGTAYLSNKVTATGLSEGKTYYYSYQKDDGTYTEPEKYVAKNSDTFRFIYVGDPQIGSSNEKKGSDGESFYQAQSEAVCNDAFNWNTTLNTAMEMSDDNVSFVLSAGDQIQTTKKKSPNKDGSTSEVEYAGYLSPDVLKSLPVATTVGNHDADNPNYGYHFNTPNTSSLGDNGVVGGDYWFTYGSALFLMLNTQDTNAAEHKQFIEQAIAANPDCKWRIVALHQDIYGSAEHSNEPEITNLRYTLVPYFEENDIDVVLTGHDHAYSRSQILKGGKKTVEYTDEAFDAQLKKDMDADTAGVTAPIYTAPANIKDDTTDPDEIDYLSYLKAVMDVQAVEPTTGDTAVNPEGILYMTANSSSGSKYYDLVPRMQSYIANRWQEDVPTYSLVDITDKSFTINTYRTDNNEKIDSSFSIRKEFDLGEATVSKVSKQVYTGKRIVPQVTVSIGGTTLTEGKDYTVSASHNKNTGRASLTLTGTGRYTGSKTISFTIVPAKATVKSVSSAKKGTAEVSMKKSAGRVSGYAISYSTDKNGKNAKTVRTTSTKRVLKGLRSGVTYYVKVRAYKSVDGTRMYGAYSAVKTVRVK